MTRLQGSCLALNAILSVSSVRSATASPNDGQSCLESSDQIISEMIDLLPDEPPCVDDGAIQGFGRLEIGIEFSRLMSQLDLALFSATGLTDTDMGTIVKGVDGLNAEIRKGRPDRHEIVNHLHQLSITMDLIRPRSSRVAIILLEMVSLVDDEVLKGRIV